MYKLIKKYIDNVEKKCEMEKEGIERGEGRMRRIEGNKWGRVYGQN